MLWSFTTLTFLLLTSPEHTLCSSVVIIVSQAISNCLILLKCKLWLNTRFFTMCAPSFRWCDHYSSNQWSTPSTRTDCTHISHFIAADEIHTTLSFRSDSGEWEAEKHTLTWEVWFIPLRLVTSHLPHNARPCREGSATIFACRASFFTHSRPSL